MCKESANMTWILAVSLFMGCILSTHGALRDVVGVCCDRGRQYAAQDGVCSDLEYFPLFDIQESDRPTCIKLAVGCCDNEAEKLLCRSGIEQRAVSGSCSEVEGDDCYSAKKDCCNCCELGLEAYHAGAPCEISNLGESCNEAFQSCCQRAFNDGDVDECTLFSELSFNENGIKCDEICVNTIGDYVCECGAGKVLGDNGFTCIDPRDLPDARPTRRPDPLDPCDTAPCTQGCRSNSVTYQCYCHQGYTLNSDQTSCRLDTPDVRPTDPPPPNLCDTANCEQDCRSNIYEYRCSCRSGFSLNRDLHTCRSTNPEVGPTDPPQPRDVCDTANCEQDCDSYNFQYRCSCRPGYLLNRDQATCRIDPNGHLAPQPTQQLPVDNRDLCATSPCTQSCRSNSVTYQCYCLPGYILNNDQTSCRDENECVTGYYQCSPGEQCVNTEGSYRCQQGAQCAEPGYQYSDVTARCEDINECETSATDVCELHQECINYDGHFYCNTLCSQGYEVVMDESGGRHTCEDVDECALGIHNCADGQRCDNLAGMFRCTRTTPCGTGYTINGNNQRCEDVDECASGLHDCTERFTCNNTVGSFRCEPCPPGFKAGPQNTCSIDINECSNVNACEAGSRCDNTYGSYRCSSLCGRGFEFISYLSRCMDIDECQRGTSTCVANQMCKNTVGGHTCQCKEGFVYDYDTQTCADINECEEGERVGNPKCRPHEGCENMPGSYRCTPSCPYGQKYELHGNVRNCTDINECLLGTHNCRGDEICINDAYNGTYRCVRCIRGTIFNSRAKRCDDIDECNNPAGRVCIGVCNNNYGSFYCSCPTGYNMIQSRVCRDVDECQVGNHRCRSDQLCFNTKGSHRCINIQCPEYYTKKISGRQMRCDKIQPSTCPQPSLDPQRICLNNRTSPIIYFPLSLRSYPTLNGEQNVLTLRTQQSPDFQLQYGNERGLFSVTKNRGAQATEGILKLVRPVTGPYRTELHMNIISYVPQVGRQVTSKAIILVDVSEYDF